MRRAAAALLFTLAWAQCVGDDSLEPRLADRLGYTEIGAGHTHESVSKQPNDWSESHFEALHKFADRKLLLGRVAAASRFGLRDTSASIGGYYPLDERTTIHAEAGRSPTHRFLPRDTLHLQLARNLGAGWGLIGGVKQLRYDTSRVDAADLTVEYYFSSFRAALSALPARSTTAGNAAVFRLQLSHYYGNENNVQLALASGDEVDKPDASGAILRTSVRSVVLFGRHWFERDWALTYTLGRTRQGESVRDAVGIGLRYRF